MTSNHDGETIGRGIIEKESLRRNHGGAIIEEGAWRNHLGSIWEPSGKGGTEERSVWESFGSIWKV